MIVGVGVDSDQGQHVTVERWIGCCRGGRAFLGVGHRIFRRSTEEGRGRGRRSESSGEGRKWARGMRWGAQLTSAPASLCMPCHAMLGGVASASASSASSSVSVHLQSARGSLRIWRRSQRGALRINSLVARLAAPRLRA